MKNKAKNADSKLGINIFFKKVITSSYLRLYVCNYINVTAKDQML